MKLCAALTLLAAGCLSAADPQPPAILSAMPTIEQVDGEQQRQRAIAMMQDNFVEWIERPAAYQQLVERECGLFPEGHLYPYFLPAMAFCHLAGLEPENAREHLQRAEQYIRLGLPTAGKIVNNNDGDLLDLQHYDRQATTLSTVSIALGLYRRAGGRDAGLKRYHRHVNQLLADALVRADGGPIHSYPNYSWNYDTVASLLALRLAPEMTPGVSPEALWRKHEIWVRQYAFDRTTGLPHSIAGFGYHEGPQPPRGCDIVMRVMVIGYVDRDAAKDLFKTVRESLERELGQFYGFDEYPVGVNGLEDNDSGPIIMDMGLSATGLAVGAALAAEDHEALNRLCRQFIFREPLLTMAAQMDLRAMPGEWFWNAVKINPRYFTGFLFGDAVLFYSLTWAPVD